MSKIVCVYHAHCADGLGAAWAVHRALGDEAEFVAAKYGDLPPYSRYGEQSPEPSIICDGLRGRDILIVDFSYPLPVLRAMAAEARSVLVLDHHKTAQEDLGELPGASTDTWDGWLKYGETDGANLAAIFDLDRSGAGLTWDYLNPTSPRPRIIDLIEDRDLWRFRFGDETRAFHAALTSYDIADLPAMFQYLDSWSNVTNDWSQQNVAYNGKFWKTELAEGFSILRANRMAVAAAVAASRRTIKIAGHVVPCACVPGSMASDAGQLLCQSDSVNLAVNKPKSISTQDTYYGAFSATYYDGADGKRHFSLRSPEGGADVGVVAKRMASYFNTVAIGYAEHGYKEHPVIAGRPWVGGGHFHAAGFDAPLGWDGE